MRILKRDLKHGKITLGIENADDLWTLNGVLKEGDRAAASTERKIKLSGSEEKTKVAKKRCYLTLEVSKIEYDGASLRVLGVIVDGPDDIPRGEHHSFGIEIGTEISVIKEWPSYLLQKLDHNATKEDPLLVVLFDREEAKLYSVTRRGVEELLRLKGKVAKKSLDNSQTANFFRELSAAISEQLERLHAKTIIAGAPAFWKEYLEKELPAEIKKKIVMTTISAVEKTAIRELLSRPEVAKVMAESTTLREMALVEDAMESLGHEKLAYGINEVEQVILAGNASIVIVTEKLLAKERENDSRKVEELLQHGESTKADIHIIDGEEPMEKIDSLGGIVAVKRW